MNNPIKKVAAIHDLSGVGRAALNSIIPILSSTGIQVCPFPTAILSSETAFYDEFTFVDLTDTMVDYMNHWKRMDVHFDCIYTGFLGSGKQVEIILEFIRYFKTKNNMVVVDPVMGDGGKLYPTITEELEEKMKKLIKCANIITPNWTEALSLLGREYKDKVDEEEVKEILLELSNEGPDIVIITSVPTKLEDNVLSVYSYEKSSEKFWLLETEYVPVDFPGTGDSFTSVIISSILNGDSLPIALDKAMQLMTLAIKESMGYEYYKGEGVLLEKVLPVLKLPLINVTYRSI